MDLEDELGRFVCTTHHYRHFTGVLYTDGIQYLAEQAGAYWLIDLVGSHQPEVYRAPFQFWDVRVSRDRSALVAVRDDTARPPLLEQRIWHTDFPLERFSFYCADNVMMLRSEYIRR